MYTAAWGYDAAGLDWERYIVGGPVFLNDLSDIVPSRGYWVEMSDAAVLSLHDTDMAEAAIPLLEGWNLVGFNHLMAMSLEDALASIAGGYNAVMGYDAEVSGWERYVVDGPSFLNNLDTFMPGKGYWIDAKAGCPSWDVNSVGAAAPRSLPASARPSGHYVSTIKPDIPYTIWGNIEANGMEMTDGAVVFLKVDGKVQSSYRIGTRMDYGAFYVLNISTNDDSTEVKLCVQVGDAVVEAAPVPPGNPGQVMCLDLSVELPPELPHRVSILHQNYPNPLNPDTWIPYQLMKESQVEIKIYTLTGQLVRTLDLGHKPAGLYMTKSRAAHWDGRNQHGEEVVSGMYLYSIEMNALSSVRKLTVVR